MSKKIVSKFNSTCYACKERIYAGDTVALDEEIGKWVHEECEGKTDE